MWLLTFCSSEIALQVVPARFELAPFRSWVLNGYWYAEPSVTHDLETNSDFVFEAGLWAELFLGEHRFTVPNRRFLHPTIHPPTGDGCEKFS